MQSNTCSTLVVKARSGEMDREECLVVGWRVGERARGGHPGAPAKVDTGSM